MIAVYYVLIIEYFTSVLALFNILLQISLSFERYLLLKNSKFYKKISAKYVLIILFVISAIYYSPVFSFYSITPVQNGNSTFVTYKSTGFFNANSGKILNSFLAFMRIILSTLGIFVMNIFTLIEFSKRVNLKKLRKIGMSQNTNSLQMITIIERTTTFKNGLSTVDESISSKSDKNVDSRAKYNITLLIIFITLTNAVGNTPYAGYRIFVSFMSVPSLVGSIVSYILLLSHGINIFIYYFFNKNFKEIFVIYFKKIFKRIRK